MGEHVKISAATLNALGHDPATKDMVVAAEVASAMAQLSTAVSLRQIIEILIEDRKATGDGLTALAYEIRQFRLNGFRDDPEPPEDLG